MLKNTLFWLFVAALVATAALHILSIELYWYWQYWWMDIIVHTLGGVSVGFAALWAGFYFGVLKNETQALVAVIVAAIVIGLAWEIFEYTTNEFVRLEMFPDAVYDMFSDIAGALIAFVIGIKSVNTEKEKDLSRTK